MMTTQLDRAKYIVDTTDHLQEELDHLWQVFLWNGYPGREEEDMNRQPILYMDHKRARGRTKS